MMTQIRLPILLISISLFLPHLTHAFAIRQPGKSSDDLTEALKIIQRAKRRLVDDSPIPYNWLEEEDVDAEGEEGRQLLKDIFEIGPSEGLVEEEAEAVEEPVEESEVDTAELEDLFNDGEEKLSEEEVENLLEDKEGEENQIPVAKEEIKEVFEVSEPNGDGTNTVKVHEDNWVITPEKTLHDSNEDEEQVVVDPALNQEQNIEVEEEPTRQLKTKKKRSEDQVLEEEMGGLEEDEDEDAGIDLSYIKKFMELEDDENNNLANALNLATRSQVERTDKYIPLEVEYLKNSIKDEETIQAIKEELGIGQTAGEEEGDEDELDEDVPQEDEIFVPGEEQIDDDEPTEEEPEDFDAEDVDGDINRMLTEKLREFLYRTALNADENGENEMEEGVVDPGLWLNGPIDPSVNEGLQRSLSPYAEVEKEEGEELLKEELRNMIEAAEEENMTEDEEEIEEGICPSVVEYTDNCAYVRDIGMGLDDEAMDLCNRHQLCYSCGAYYDMDANACDKGFLVESDQLCEDDENCKDQAAGLYFFLLRDHVFTPRELTGFSCAARCTFDYIVGADEA